MDANQIGGEPVVSTPLVAALMGLTGWTLLILFTLILWAAMWYNKHIAIEFYDVGEHAGKLTRASSYH